jgi:hypothetical protein
MENSFEIKSLNRKKRFMMPLYKRFYILKLFLTAVFIFISAESLTQEKTSLITYIHPKPGSEYVTPQSNILIKIKNEFANDLKSKDFQFKVEGEQSGSHPGEIIISDNTIIFNPRSDFQTSEKVSVTFTARNLNWNDTLKYSFTTSNIKEFDPEILLSVSDDYKLWDQQDHSEFDFETKGKVTTINGVSVPSDFPHFAPSILNDGIAEGRIFLNNWIGNPYIMILENDGTPYFYQRVEDRSRDFKVQPNGMLTRRYLGNLWGFVGMDSNYTVIDTFLCTNGYGTDEHEIYMLEDGHYFLIALGYRYVDMSVIVPGGNPNAIVIDNHIQEFDENHNLVFEWLCYNHFNITDAVGIGLTQATINYVHMNSVAVDYDGHIIISSRHQSKVAKINRQTGEVMWELDGVNNDFTYIDDEYGISYQHFARPVEGKPNHYTIFDNGNYHNPKFSRAVEFQLDIINMTATKVWEYRHTPDRYTHWMGNAQRLQNGNTLINYADGSLPKATEVTQSGEIVYEGDFVNYAHCYRTYRFEWESVVKVPYLIAESYSDKVTLIFNKFGDHNVEKYIIYGGLSPDPITPLDSTINTSIDLTNLSNNQLYYFRVTARNTDGIESSFSNQENVLVRFNDPGQNFILNGDFSDDSNYWIFHARNGAIAQGSVINGEFFVNIESPGTNYYDIQLIQESFPIINGKKYVFEFDARATSERLIEPRIAQNGGSFIDYSKIGLIEINSEMQHFKYHFEMTDPSDINARVVLNCGNSMIKCIFDNISLREDLPSVIEENNSVIPDDFFLYPNYPNPFNPTTNIGFQIAEFGFVSLKIYDVLGNEVTTLIKEELPAGNYNVNFDDGNLSSGIYFYRLSVNEFSMTRKMVLLR